MKHRIVTAAQMKEIEQAGDAHGLPYLQMMENAGLAAYAELQKQLLAPPGVFDMDGFHCAVHIYMGNKTVGAVKKNAVHDLSVFQCLLHFHFCLIRLRQNHWLHAKTGSCKRQPLAGARLFLTASSSTDHAGCSRRRPPPAFRCPAQTPPWVPDRGRGSGAVRRFRSPQRATGCGAHPP